MRLGDERVPTVSMNNHSMDNNRLQFWSELMQKVSYPLTEPTVTNDLPEPNTNDNDTAVRVSKHMFIGLLFSFLLPHFFAMDF